MKGDEKRYYWFKLNHGFFTENHRVRALENTPAAALAELEGTLGKDDTRQISNMAMGYLYLKLLADSCPHEGELKYDADDNYDMETLADTLGCPVAFFKAAVGRMEKLKLLHVGEDGVVRLPELRKYIGSETWGARRKRQQRKGNGERGDGMQNADRGEELADGGLPFCGHGGTNGDKRGTMSPDVPECPLNVSKCPPNVSKCPTDVASSDRKGGENAPEEVKKEGKSPAKGGAGDGKQRKREAVCVDDKCKKDSESAGDSEERGDVGDKRGQTGDKRGTMSPDVPQMSHRVQSIRVQSNRDKECIVSTVGGGGDKAAKAATDVNLNTDGNEVFDQCDIGRSSLPPREMRAYMARAAGIPDWAFEKSEKWFSDLGWRFEGRNGVFIGIHAGNYGSLVRRFWTKEQAIQERERQRMEAINKKADAEKVKNQPYVHQQEGYDATAVLGF